MSAIFIVISVAIILSILPSKEDPDAIQWKAVSEMESRGEFATAAEIREFLLRRQHG